MTFVAVKDLKRSRWLWEKLEAARELIVTKDGKPCAVLVSVAPEDLDSTLSEIRRARFSAAVTRVRRQARKNPPEADAIEKAVLEARRRRPE